MKEKAQEVLLPHPGSSPPLLLRGTEDGAWLHLSRGHRVLGLPGLMPRHSPSFALVSCHNDFNKVVVAMTPF